MQPRFVELSELDLAELIRPGDTIHWPQASGEPLALMQALVDQRERLGGVRVFFGLGFSDILQPEHADHLSFRTLGGYGTNAALARAGVLEVVPCHASAVPRLIEQGVIPADVFFLHVSPRDEHGMYSLGAIVDHVRVAIDKARVVIAQVNERMPRTMGETQVHPSEIDLVVPVSHPLVRMPAPVIGPTELAIADLVAERIEDGAVLQFGIGSIPEAICDALGDKRDLGIHSGMVGDKLVDLVERGIVTNARKAIDSGISVTATLIGTERLYDHVHDNPAVQMRPITYTHAGSVIAQLDRFTSINSAVEVDLTGQVNAETVGGLNFGAVGGAVDFVRGSALAPAGQSIMALPATARSGSVSRIVARLQDGVTSTPRSDVDLVVTEFGVAEMRGRSLAERARNLIAVAHPDFRARLEEASHRLC